MSTHFANLGNLVIDNGGTTSSALTAYLDDAKTITITAPAALSGTIGIEVSVDGGTTYTDLTSGGTDVTIGAGNAVTITDPAFNGLRVVSGGAEGAERTFQVFKTFTVGR